jgi:hypothetical protein
VKMERMDLFLCVEGMSYILIYMQKVLSSEGAL